MTDKIKIGADLDTSQIEKQLSDLQKKLNNMRGLSPGGGISQLSSGYAATGQKDRAAKLEEFRMKEEKRHKEQMAQMLKKEESTLDRLLGQYRAIDNLKEKGLIKEEKFHERRKELVKDVLDTEEKISTLREQSGGGDKGGANFSSIFNKVAGIAAGVGAMAKAGLDMADFINRRRGEFRAERTVSLAESMYEPSKRAIQGQGFDDLLFAKEKGVAREQAFGMGQGQFGINRGKGLVSGIGGAALIGAGALGLLAAPFTGGLSLAATGAALAGGGAYALTANKGMGYEALTGNMGEIDKITGQQIMENYKIREAEQKAKDPTTTMFKEFISENRSDLIKGLRQSGMQESDFIKQYVQGQGLMGEEEFGFGQRTNMTQAMLASGGDTSAGFGQNMVTALQAERSLGLTNSGQAMGRLSNYLGKEESEEAFVRVLAKGVGVGLDKSEFREQQKDYLDQVTAIAQNTGVGENLIASLMTAGLSGGDISRKDVEFAGQQAQQLTDELSKSTGLEGAMKYRGIAKNSAFQKMSDFDRMMMGKLRVEDINVDSDAMKYYHDKAGGQEGSGKTLEQFTEELLKVFVDSRTGGYGNLSDRYQEIQGQLKGKDLTPEEREVLQGEAGQILKFIRGKDQTTFEQDVIASKGLGGFQDRMGPKGQEEYGIQKKEYEELKWKDAQSKGMGGVSLSESEQGRLKDLSKRFSGMKDRDDSSLEFLFGGANRMQNQEINAKDSKGKDLEGTLSEFGKNASEYFNKTVAERLDLKQFQKALEDGATEVIQALLNKIRGVQTKAPTQTQRQYLKKASASKDGIVR